MDYLYTLYYKNKNEYEKIYKSRIDFSETLKTNLSIKPYRENLSFQLYYVFNRETSNLIDLVNQNNYTLEKLNDELPIIAKSANLLDIISSELKSSNDLEGVKSEKKEIIETTRNILNSKDPKKLRLTSMIKSYLLLLKEDSLKVPSDLKDIRKIYDEITKGEIEKKDQPDGKYFRLEPVYVQKKNSVNGQIIHQGVSGENKIEESMLNLINFLLNTDLDLLIRVAIAHYYFGYIHPFYDGNGRVNRFISSIFLRSKYSYLTSMSLARGCWINKTSYYKSFDITNSKINKGEVNYFVDEFLKTLIAGQEDIIFNLTTKIENLKLARKCIEAKSSTLNTELKKSILFLLCQNYYFDNNSGLTRDEIFEYTDDFKNKNKKIRELKELEKDGFIRAIKERPLIYTLDKNFIENL